MINPFKSKKGLGRGLSSLIGDSERIDYKKNLSISSLVRNKYQPRKKFDEISLEELTNSIRERGIVQPIVVRPSTDHENKFETFPNCITDFASMVNNVINSTTHCEYCLLINSFRVKIHDILSSYR